MRYLFLVSIGPVQDFIASARRTRDLAFGSWFLSELARAAADKIAEVNEIDSLIFPAPAEKNLLAPNAAKFPVPNKIIAYINQSPQTMGEEVEKAVRDRLSEIRTEAYKKVKFADDKKRGIAEAQVADLPEILWAGLPCEEQDYAQKRDDLEALMAARKNTRNFGPMPAGNPEKPEPKSSIDGQMESVIPEWQFPARRDSDDKQREKAQDLYNRYGAGAAERLSGIDLLKRRGSVVYQEPGQDKKEFIEHFQSTSHIATLPFLKRLERLQGEQLKITRQAWLTYLAELKKFADQKERIEERIPDSAPSHPLFDRSDGSMLLESRLVDVLYLPGKDKMRLRDAQHALQHFYKVLDEQCKAADIVAKRPDGYYALLQADGDGMGQIIDAQAEQGSKRHRALSQKLAEFARQARTIVEEHRGVLIYAGGDDVTAFLPLDTMLECALKLAKTFPEVLKGFADQEGRKPSLSAGIAIAHHLEPLAQVRRLAKEAEERAKSLDKKNAISITLSKRSGEDYHLKDYWGNVERRLPSLVDYCLRDAIPAGTPYELRDLLVRFDHSPEATQPGAPYAEVIKLDALRIIKRKLSVPRGKFSQKQVAEVEQFFKTWLGIEQPPHSDMVEIETVPLAHLIDELIVARILADAQALADPQKEKHQA